jgi:exodeoxyribonuclease V alpha subunit
MSLSSQGRQFRAPSISDLTVKVRGRVEHLYYCSPRFSAGRLRTRSGDLVAFAGALMVKAQDQVVLHGVWERHPKYGQQLKVSHFTFDQRLDVDGLALYLANHPLLKGIGPVRAKKIAETFGEDFDRVLEEEPARIAEAAKLPMAAMETLRDEWLRTRTVNATLTWLSSFGLTHHQATSLIDRLGNSAVTALQT